MRRLCTEDMVSDIGTGLLVIERHNDRRALTFPSASERKPFAIQIEGGRLDGGEHGDSRLLQEAFLSLCVPAKIDHRSSGTYPAQTTPTCPIPEPGRGQSGSRYPSH